MNTAAKFTPAFLLDHAAAREVVMAQFAPRLRRDNVQPIEDSVLEKIFEPLLTDADKAYGPTPLMLQVRLLEAMQKPGEWMKIFIYVLRSVSGGIRTGLLTKVEAEERLQDHSSRSIVSHVSHVTKNGAQVVFFSDDHCLIPSDCPVGFTPITNYLPYKIKERPGFEDGFIKTVEEMCRLHYSDPAHCRVIETVEELAQWLDS